MDRNPTTFLDMNTRGNDMAAAPQVRQYGGVEPRDMCSLPTVSLRSTPAVMTSFDGGGRSPHGQRSSPSPRAACNVVFNGLQMAGDRKEKRLMALVQPEEVDDTFRLRRMSLTAVGKIAPEASNAAYSRCATQDGQVSDNSDSYSEISDIPPLEERLCLEDLQRIMLLFSSTSDPPPVTDATPAEKGDELRHCGPVASSQANSSCTNTDTNTKEDQSQCEQTAFADGNTTRAGSVMRRRASVAGRRSRCRSVLTVSSRNGMRYVLETKEELQRVLMHEWNSGKNTEEKYSRVLTEEEFSQALRGLIPAAGDDEITDLMKRVDYEAKGCITWDDFATFLVSQGRHHSNLSQGTFGELSSIPEPETCSPSLQHVNGTCMDADRRRNILLTGGSEGTVRAWNLNTLASCGVVFSGDYWVVGVHWANHIQGIIIVTMDRRVIILDSKTLEIRRLFRGRLVVETLEGYMYAHDSVETVRVGATMEQSFGMLGIRGSGFPPRPAQRKQGAEGRKKAKVVSGVGTVFSCSAKGSSVQCHVEECTFVGLVDAVTCSLYHHTASSEDMLLLATAVGEVRFYSIPRTTKRVVAPHAVILLHEKRINKMGIHFQSNSLLTASDDGYVKMTSFDTGATLRTFPTCGPPPHSAVHDFDIDPNLRMLVTVGPERYGIVWDLSHDTPMCQLDSHNGPCRCCAMQIDQRQIVTVGADGVIFIFEAQGFRLVQVIGVERLHPQRVISDPRKKRIVCLSTYPYCHGRNQNVAWAYSAKYKGHMAPMVGVLYSATHDLIITIDVEGLVMTWKRATGCSSFTFQIKEFSDSAVMNAARPTCFALDKLERRLLTGFNNGAAAVWNLMNGQTTNVITAAAEGSHSASVAPGVTALGTLVREGFTFFIFAAGGCLYSTRESSTFTIANASKWEVPSHFGEVLHIMAISPHCIVCGTSYGALFFYRVLAERQEGSVLWVVEAGEAPTRSVTSNVPDARRCEQSNAATTSRIVRIFPLETVGEHILMAVHADGTVVLWHTVRRMMMGVVSVRCAFPAKGLEVGLTHVAVYYGGGYLVFSDELGNIHVCSIALREVYGDGSALENCATLVHDEGKKPTVCWPGSPFYDEEFPPAPVPIGDPAWYRSNPPHRSVEMRNQMVSLQAKPVDIERTLYTFSRFYRENVFHCGFNSVSGLAIVDHPREVATHMPRQQQGLISGLEGSREETCRGVSHTCSPHMDVSTESLCELGSLQNVCVPLPNPSATMMITVSSGVDNLTRVFTLDGLVVGEYGMNTWVAGKESSYQFLCRKPSKRLPPRSCSTDGKNFLAEALSAEKIHISRQVRNNRGGKVSAPRSECQGLQDGVAQSRHESILPTFQNACATGPENVNSERHPVTQLSANPIVRDPPSNPVQQGCEVRQREADVVKQQTVVSPVTLATFMKPRRFRSTALKGLVKPKFIDALRGLHVEGGGDDLASFTVSPESRKGTKKQVRGDQPSEHSNVVPSRTGSIVVHYTPASACYTTDLSASEVNQTTGVEGRPSSLQPVFASIVSTPHQGTHSLKVQSRSVHGRRCPMTSPQDGDHTAAVTKTYPRQLPLSSGAVNNTASEGCSSPLATLHDHMDSQRRHLLSLGCKDPVVLAVPCVTGGSTRGEAGATCSHDSKRGTSISPSAPLRWAQGSSVLEARSRVAQITSRLVMAPIEEIMPPKGTRVREQTAAWKDVVKSVTNASQ